MVSRKIEGPVLDSRFPKDFSPWFLTGFTDAEGNFDITFVNNVRALAKTGIKFRFRLSANYRDVVLLCAIKNYFGSGSISLIRKDTNVIILEISSIEVIKNKIIPFFDSYPLKVTKYYDYLTWRNCFFDFLENRDNLESKLLLIERLKEAKNNLNRNKKEFLVPIDQLVSIDPNYVAGFCNGDGSTTLVTAPNSFHKGFGIATLNISQHINSLSLLEAIRDHLTVGKIVISKEAASLVVSNKEEINNIIIPYFCKYPFYGAHAISFLKWRHIVEYLLKIREDKSIFNRENKSQIISNIRDIWHDKSTLVYTDLTLEFKELIQKIKNLQN